MESADDWLVQDVVEEEQEERWGRWIQRSSGRRMREKRLRMGREKERRKKRIRWCAHLCTQTRASSHMSNSSHPPPTRTCTLRGSTSRGYSGRCYLYRVSFHCIRVLVCPRLVGLYSYIPYEVIDMLLSWRTWRTCESSPHLDDTFHLDARYECHAHCRDVPRQYPEDLCHLAYTGASDSASCVPLHQV